MFTRPKRKELCLWAGIIVLLALPISLMTMSYKGQAAFTTYSQQAGRAFMVQAGFMPDAYYQQFSMKKPAKIDHVAFVQSPWGKSGRYLLNTNLLKQSPLNSSEIAAIIEERISDVPGPFFLKPLLHLTAWQPRRLVIYGNGTMSGAVPREFKAFNLDGFVSSDDLRASASNPIP